jgi:hypothetical protein
MVHGRGAGPRRKPSVRIAANCDCWLTTRRVELALLHENRLGRHGGHESDAGMVWIVYWPLILVLAVAIVAGIAILVRKLRGKNDNPFIVKR